MTPPVTGLQHVGLIAGEGNFPLLIARSARTQNVSVTAIGIRDITDPELEELVDQMHWIDFGQVNRLITLCHESDIQHALLAGRIKHNNIFQLGKMDWRGVKMVARTTPRTADALLGSFTQELTNENIEVLDSTLFLREAMPPAGLLTPGHPTNEDFMTDLEFGQPIAHAIAGQDIGQTIVVKQQTIVAVEAMEGTNLCIKRAGDVAGSGCLVIKIAKPRQDSRFDVPVIGLTTIRYLASIQARGLAFPGGKVLFFDQEEAVALAEAHGITLYAW